jgi:hypothetical protein
LERRCGVSIGTLTSRQIAEREAETEMVELTWESLHALSSSPGGNGFTRAQILLMGFPYPPPAGWLRSLIGAKVSLAGYERVREAASVKGKASRGMAKRMRRAAKKAAKRAVRENRNRSRL